MLKNYKTHFLNRHPHSQLIAIQRLPMPLHYHQHINTATTLHYKSQNLLFSTRVLTISVHHLILVAIKSQDLQQILGKFSWKILLIAQLQVFSLRQWGIHTSLITMLKVDSYKQTDHHLIIESSQLMIDTQTILGILPQLVILTVLLVVLQENKRII